MKKVGIITLVGAFNYGNRLQNYAVTWIWRKLGFAPTTLIWNQRDFYHALRHFASGVLGRARKDNPELMMSAQRRAAFREFDKNIDFALVDSLNSRELSEYDYFSIGSDQVWNPAYVRDMKWAFAEFAERDKRVALSPSFGIDRFRKDQLHGYQKGLNGFPSLSVREEQGAELIGAITGREAAVLLDPTLMLDASSWRQVSNASVTPSEPFVFSYVLGDQSSQLNDGIADFAKRNNLLVAGLSDRDDGCQIPAGPAEFIDLIDKSHIVVTNSYHAVVFASLFRKPFVLLRRGGGQDMSSRFNTLLGKLDYKPASSLNHEGVLGAALEPGSAFQDTLKVERAKFAEYLSSVLGRSFDEVVGVLQ